MDLITIKCHDCEVTIEEKDGALEVICFKDGEVVEQMSCPCGDSAEELPSEEESAVGGDEAGEEVSDEVSDEASDEASDEVSDEDDEVALESETVKTFEQFIGDNPEENSEESNQSGKVSE